MNIFTIYVFQLYDPDVLKCKNSVFLKQISSNLKFTIWDVGGVGTTNLYCGQTVHLYCGQTVHLYCYKTYGITSYSNIKFSDLRGGGPQFTYIPPFLVLSVHMYGGQTVHLYCYITYGIT